jgi:hypothetical protein
VDAVERLPTHEIDTVRKFVELRNNTPMRQEIEGESIQALITAGLVRVSAGSPIGGKLSYLHTRTADTFVKLNLDENSRGA